MTVTKHKVRDIVGLGETTKRGRKGTREITARCKMERSEKSVSEKRNFLGTESLVAVGSLIIYHL